MREKIKKSTKGALLIEALLAIALSAILLPALLTGLITSNQGKAQQKLRISAVALMKEAEEAVRSVRESGWSSLPGAGTYHPTVASNAWSLASGSESINGYTRSVVISNVYRDASGAIVASGASDAVLDPSTKKVDISVNWNTPYPSTATTTLYLTRFLQNNALIQTTFTDFAAGTATSSGTVLTNTAGGEVTLGAGGGGGDWCNPSLSVTSVDLSRQGVPTSISASDSGTFRSIVTGTGGNASGPTFVKTDITGNSSPSATFRGEFNNSKANAVFTEGNYGYIATTNNSEEIQILDLTQYSDPPTNSVFTKVGTFNAPGNSEGDSIFARGSVGYMTALNKFYTFDLSSHSGARSQTNPTTVPTLAGTGLKTVVVGNYAYVATNSTTTQLQIIDVTDPVNPSIVASFASGNGKAGTDVSVNASGTRAYLTTQYASAILPDVFIIDTTTKSGSLSAIGSGFNTNVMTPRGISIATGNKLIVVGQNGAKQYQTLNVTNESSPVLCGSLAITNGAYAVTSILQNDGYAFSYVTTGDANAELKMVLGGAGGQFSSTGTFTSAPVDATVSAAFNRFIPTFTQPNQTTLKFQVAVANAVNNSCTNASYSFVGPDGTASSYFTGEGQIPLLSSGNYQNPGRCFEYKASFSTLDYTASPVLYDVSVNFSP